uniref:Protein MIZU-KUSSEI 1 n=1 Tax=Aegilops tauschii subsp. strangulata TaxID=200361 RepID=A0A453RG04_AEGTS
GAPPPVAASRGCSGSAPARCATARPSAGKNLTSTMRWNWRTREPPSSSLLRPSRTLLGREEEPLSRQGSAGRRSRGSGPRSWPWWRARGAGAGAGRWGRASPAPSSAGAGAACTWRCRRTRARRRRSWWSCPRTPPVRSSGRCPPASSASPSSARRRLHTTQVILYVPCLLRGERRRTALVEEPTWRAYCNGRKCGYAVRRECGAEEWRLLRAVEPVSVGAGVVPDGGAGEGDLMYMRARFERVVGSRDSEAFYMINPDGNGGPELSIYLLRV